MPNLVGIGLSQVPTNSMLGGLAYQSPDHASIKDLDLKNLSQINSEIADTAVDIFIYDTSKDSDGGAWRKRTTHTSWYNETLGTATRGTRREFPAVAVIVAETSRVVIYDGDDPDLPMWMVFNGGSNGINNVPLLQYVGNDYHPRMLNGVLVIGQDTGGDNWGNPIINFISEYIVRADPQGGEGGIFNGRVAQRNDSVGFNSPGTLVINNSLIRDVAMIVLPDAHVDPATGLPKPTIAFATSNGVNVVYGDADDTVCTVSGVSTFEVRFYNGGKRIVFREGGNAISYGLLPTASSVNFASWREGYFNETTTFPSTLDQSNIDLYSNNYQELGVTSNDGLTLIDVNPAAQATSAGCYITSDYNTGWMHGDIKGAFLSDTDTTNAVGTELHPNGNSNFSSTDVSYINNTASGTATVTSNQLVLSGGTAGYSDHVITVNTEVGAKYIITVDYVAKSGGGSIGMYVNNAYLNELNDNGGYIARSTGNTYTFYFTADATTENIDLVTGGSGSDTHTFDNWTIKKVEEDRSVNNNGLQVFGTITKSAVATGAELVAYSGFSGSNYLQQPYNSDLDFGTGDLSISFWYKMTSTASSQCLLHRGDGASGTWGSGNIIQIEMDGTYLEFQIAGSLFSPLTQVQVPIAKSATGQWQHFVGVRSGGIMSVYIDSVKYGNVASTQNATNTSARTWIGERPNISRPASNTSMTLFRMSASAPSAEQVKKMYEDEKFLFQENAKCTLYGSSDAITALAYDEVTDRLHVGTSSGRSDFQGLRRINNTTTAVTTAISAHDEFIVEQ